MSEWREYIIDEIVLDYFDYRGKTPKKLGMDWGNGNIKALSANNVEKGQINFNKECYLASEELYKIWMNKGHCEKGDVVITMEAPLGNIAQIPDNNKYILSQRTLLFKTKKELVNNDYFYYVLSDKTFQDELIRNSTGSTVVGIQQKKLVKLKVELPLLPTQRKIAHILSTSDAVIENTQAIIAKYKAIKQGMLHDLFTRGIDLETGKLRPKYENAPELYKESKVGWIPKEWELNKLGEFSFITKLAGFEYTIHFDYSKSGSIVAVRALNIKQGKLDLGSIHTIPKETSDALPRSQLKKGDLVISYVGTVGQVAVIPESNRFHLAPNVAKISVDIKEINPFYLNQFLNADIGQNEIIKLVSSTTQAALSMQNLREVRFLRPNLKEQVEIEKRLKNIDSNIETEQGYLLKFQHLKVGLMGDLLSGRKRVKIKEE